MPQEVSCQCEESLLSLKASLKAKAASKVQCHSGGSSVKEAEVEQEDLSQPKPKAKAKAQAKSKAEAKSKAQPKAKAQADGEAKKEKKNAKVSKKASAKAQPACKKQKKDVSGKETVASLSKEEISALLTRVSMPEWYSDKESLMQIFPEDAEKRFTSRCYHRVRDFEAMHKHAKLQWVRFFRLRMVDLLRFSTHEIMYLVAG